MTSLPPSMNKKHPHLETSSVPREIALVFIWEETLYPHDGCPSTVLCFSPFVGVVQMLFTTANNSSPAKSQIWRIPKGLKKNSDTYTIPGPVFHRMVSFWPWPPPQEENSICGYITLVDKIQGLLHALVWCIHKSFSKGRDEYTPFNKACREL